MFWPIPVFLTILTTSFFTPWLINKAANKPRAETLRFWQFILATIYSTLVVALLGALHILFPQAIGPPIKTQLVFAGVFLIGILNAAAVQFQWKAFGQSLSKTSVFNHADRVVAFFIGLIVFGESTLLDPLLILGLIFLSIAALIAGWGTSNFAKSNRSLLTSIAGFGILWGITNAATRFIALQDIPFAQFLLQWYLATALGTYLINVLTGSKTTSLAKPHRSLTLVLSTAIWGGNLFHFLSSKFAPLVVTQPLFMASQIIGPLFVGLLITKEISHLTSKDKLIIAIGSIGAILVATGFITS